MDSRVPGKLYPSGTTAILHKKGYIVDAKSPFGRVIQIRSDFPKLEGGSVNALELIRFQLDTSKALTASLLADMQDAPLTEPTPKGGNHPTWVAGHLAYSEANLTSHILSGKENPLLAWKDLFGRGSEPRPDASQYPSLKELLSRWDEVRSQTLEILDSLGEDDLEKPSANPPPGREDFFGTYAKVFSFIAMHTLMHRGQVADARRAAGRSSLMG